MREIKFRGRRVDNNEWVYGGYYKHFNGKIGILTGDKTSYHDAIMDEVIPETVGQFAGLRDKNGRDVYEGDIVKGQERSEYGGIASSWTGVCYWDNESGAFKFKDDLGDIYTLDDFSFEQVIGNICENPELAEIMALKNESEE